MALIETSELTPGMTTLEPVINSQGNILLAKEVEITDKHIRILKTWGISVVHIKDEVRDTLPSKLTENELGTIRSIIERKMKLNPDPHPFLENLKEILLKRFEQNPERVGIEEES